MPKVTFILRDKTRRTVEFEQGSLPFDGHGLPESFLNVALENGIPLEHACGGSCACTTCHLIIREGMQNLSEMEENEADRLDTAWDLTTSSRLGCQAVIHGDVVAHVSREPVDATGSSGVDAQRRCHPRGRCASQRHEHTPDGA